MLITRQSDRNICMNFGSTFTDALSSELLKVRNVNLSVFTLLTSNQDIITNSIDYQSMMRKD
jgi:hypothetical protein